MIGYSIQYYFNTLIWFEGIFNPFILTRKNKGIFNPFILTRKNKGISKRRLGVFGPNKTSHAHALVLIF
jgi:hypothetical protein